MATLPFRFKNIEAIYNQGLTGDYASFGSTNPNVAQYTRLQQISTATQPTIRELVAGAVNAVTFSSGPVGEFVSKIVPAGAEQYLSPLVKRFQYIKENQIKLVEFYKSTRGIEFFAKQVLLHKTNQYISPVGVAAGIVGLLPANVPLYGGAINSITKNYNGQRDFNAQNFVTQAALSSLGQQGVSPNFIGLFGTDFDITGARQPFVDFSTGQIRQPASTTSLEDRKGIQSVFGAFLPFVDGDPKLYSRYIKDVRRNKANGRLELLYNQLNGPAFTPEAEFNLDYDFNKFNHSKKDIFGLFGRFFNRRYEEHHVSRPGSLKLADKELYNLFQRPTEKNRNQTQPGGMGPLAPVVRYKFKFKNPNDVDKFNFQTPRNRTQPYTEDDSYIKSLEDQSDRGDGELSNTPSIDYYFSNNTGSYSQIGYKNSIGDVINQVVTSSLGLTDKGAANSISDRVYEDLIKFNIQFNLEDPSLDKTKILQFRALLTDSITDTMNASYTSARYIGRADQVHSYDGFTRNMSLGFVIYPRNPDEHPIIMEKLSILASLLTPSYSKKGKVVASFTNNAKQTEYIYENLLGNIPRAPIVKLTIGNYIKEQYGYITNLTYSIKNANLWDIYTELPMVVEVTSFNFVPIHDFVVSQENPNFISAGRNSYVPEEFLLAQQTGQEIDINQVG